MFPALPPDCVNQRKRTGRLKKIVADLTLDLEVLQDVVKSSTPCCKRCVKVALSG